jgi:3-methyladenine DNA glycosylase AlkD
MKKRYMKPWPLERAELIQKTEQHRRDETARADAAIAVAEQARRYARQEALEALAKHLAEEDGLIKMTFREAHRELAKMAGRDVAEQVEQMWGMVSPAEKFKKHALNVVMEKVKVAPLAYPSIGPELARVVTRLAVLPHTFSYTVMIPR